MALDIDKGLLDQVVVIAKAAGEKILSVYNRAGDIDVMTKDDDSPLTEADLAANQCLVDGLSAISADIPVLTEESGLPDFSERQQWSRYWLVDPLDGTKEFINRNGEFTVNVALIEGGTPVLGVVYVPVLDTLYSGIAGVGAWQSTGDEAVEISVRTVASRTEQGLPVEVVGSRRHGAEAVDTLCAEIQKQLGPVENKSVGSSLKLCLVAAGQADLYPRLGLTSEWDTAAAQAVVEAAGGLVLDDQLQPLRYNQKESILNPYFYVVGDSLEVWGEILK
jgi:3'(2'), 5'-bisphosphate nucleotidase